MSKAEYVSPIPNEAVGFEAIRYVKNGNDRRYEPVLFNGDKPYMAIDQIYRQMKVFGYIANSDDDLDGFLDLVDKSGDIIDHIPVTAKGLSWVYKKYDLRVVKH